MDSRTAWSTHIANSGTARTIEILCQSKIKQTNKRTIEPQDTKCGDMLGIRSKFTHAIIVLLLKGD